MKLVSRKLIIKQRFGPMVLMTLGIFNSFARITIGASTGKKRS